MPYSLSSKACTYQLKQLLHPTPAAAVSGTGTVVVKASHFSPEIDFGDARRPTASRAWRGDRVAELVRWKREKIEAMDVPQVPNLARKTLCTSVFLVLLINIKYTIISTVYRMRLPEELS